MDSIRIEQSSIDLYPQLSIGKGKTITHWLELNKESNLSGDKSNQAAFIGIQDHPFNFERAVLLQTVNPHHAACIKTRTLSIVGNGFLSENEAYGQQPTYEESKADRILDPLCDVSFQDVLSDCEEQENAIGNGAMEIVRQGEKITGIHHIPGHLVYLYIEDEKYHRHYVVTSSEGEEKRFALFGDKQDFYDRWRAQGNDFGDGVDSIDDISEIIVFRQPSSLSRWYGFPTWLSAVPSIELTQFFHQWKFDFFLNRGVPEYMLFISGGELSKESWTKVENALKSNIGLGNSHKSIAINIPETDINIQLEKLSVDSGGEDEFTKIKESLALDIVTAHQVPPLLAGIQIPGKLGAVNEFPNALLSFHSTAVWPAQRRITRLLGNTLGNPRLNGGLGLTARDFRLRRIIDTINLQQADTISRMRTPAATAQIEGRDINDGLRD